MGKKVIIGGTFDFLHAGHKALLRKALELGDVVIGITTAKMAEKVKQREVSGLAVRKAELEEFIKNESGKAVEIVELDDKFGPSLEENFDYIVVSPETYETALLINTEREKIGRRPIEIVKINYVLAEDGKPISSTRIANGEIDREGKLLQ